MLSLSQESWESEGRGQDSGLKLSKLPQIFKNNDQYICWFIPKNSWGFSKAQAKEDRCNFVNPKWIRLLQTRNIALQFQEDVQVKRDQIQKVFDWGHEQSWFYLECGWRNWNYGGDIECWRKYLCALLSWHLQIASDDSSLLDCDQEVQIGGGSASSEGKASLLKAKSECDRIGAKYLRVRLCQEEDQGLTKGLMINIYFA